MIYHGFAKPVDFFPDRERQTSADRSFFVSIAAGVPLKSFSDILGPSAAIIRAMPNTPAAIGKGMVAIKANSHVDARDADFVETLLKTCGETATLSDEAMMDAVTAISSSGPAYLFYFIECLIEAAKSFGFDEVLATKLATQTVYGAASMAAVGAMRRQSCAARCEPKWHHGGGT